MNERIQELSKRAWAHVNLQVCIQYDKTGTQLFDEKFAELIVQECIDICLRNQLKPTATTAGECAYDIQEYFGVD